MELEDLLAVPGMATLLEFAPLFAGALWLLLTVVLWRGGFNDLVEQITRPRWAGAARARAFAMLPVRAVLLSVVAGFGSAMTTLGIAFNIAILLNIWNGFQLALSQAG